MKTLQATQQDIADRNIRRWLLNEEVRRRLLNRKIDANVGPYLTISRETGAGGNAIARRVGALLGWQTLDGELLDCMAEKYGTPRSLLQFVDETEVSWLESLFASWNGKRGLSQEAYVHRLSQLMLLAAHHGNVIFVGRGGRFILPRERGLAVRIIAPFEFRAEQIMLARGISMAEARLQIQQADRARQAFATKYFHHNSADPHEYDITINVEKVDQRAAAELIAAEVRLWMIDFDI